MDAQKPSVERALFRMWPGETLKEWKKSPGVSACTLGLFSWCPRNGQQVLVQGGRQTSLIAMDGGVSGLHSAAMASVIEPLPTGNLGRKAHMASGKIALSLSVLRCLGRTPLVRVFESIAWLGMKMEVATSRQSVTPSNQRNVVYSRLI